MAYRLQHILGLVAPVGRESFIRPRVLNNLTRAKLLKEVIDEGMTVRIVLRSEKHLARLSDENRERVAGYLDQLSRTGSIRISLGVVNRAIKERNGRGQEVITQWVPGRERFIRMTPGIPKEVSVRDACILLDADKYGYLLREVDPARPSYDPDDIDIETLVDGVEVGVAVDVGGTEDGEIGVAVDPHAAPVAEYDAGEVGVAAAPAAKPKRKRVDDAA